MSKEQPKKWQVWEYDLMLESILPEPIRNFNRRIYEVAKALERDRKAVLIMFWKVSVGYRNIYETYKPQNRESRMGKPFTEVEWMVIKSALGTDSKLQLARSENFNLHEWLAKILMRTEQEVAKYIEQKTKKGRKGLGLL